ncbi:hypothetical protein N8E87_07505 [Avibacterium paragallinarum]|uniref:hypothetical protein n=1 Tax=Avibacterium paragallinarum TaxID=728 RepID=UPI0021F7A823|nr:hypothetical protein [Avibacterium paragallinarum]UXN36045.1 hypothetical protein N8E87_07505 [Avibacterium paragallinarum]
MGAISAAANTDWNNRQLHPDEMKRIKELSQGDKEKEQRLTIAACALVHCSAQLSEENPIYEQTKNLEKLGSSEAYAEERALLKQQKVLKEMVVGLPPSDETMSVPHSLFTYGMNDKLLDKTSKANETYGVSTRIGGALQATGGALISASSTASAITACAGSSGLACGGAAALGAIGTSYGVDQANAGVKSLLTGKNYSTYGSQLLSQMTGISPETAEAVYGLPLMWNGGNALRVTIPHTIHSGIPLIRKTMMNPTTKDVMIGLGSNATLQFLSGQEFNLYELGGAGIASGISPKLNTNDSIRFNMGIAAGVSLASGGNILQDTALGGLGALLSSKVKNPIISPLVSETIQKLPYLGLSNVNNEVNNEK